VGPGKARREPADRQEEVLHPFPFPYSNGRRVHLGHVYSMTKADFTTRFKRLQGFNTLFPFGFLCTGQPIQAAVERLKQEIAEHGNPPVYKEPPKRTPQYEILKMMNIPESEIPSFTDPYYWFRYFPPLAIQDLKEFGSPIDYRRSFITTDYNPYFDSFVQWQYTNFKEKDLVFFGKRPAIYSIKDQQMNADHDRAEGEGVCPQEYSILKIKVLTFNKALEQIKGRKVFLGAATLRAETLYGQTNVYILPTATYGAFEMVNDEVFILSERSAKNLAF